MSDSNRRIEPHVETFLNANRCSKCDQQPAWSHATINEPIIFECPLGHRYTDRFGQLQIRMVVDLVSSRRSVPPSDESRCPDFNPYCDGSDLLHGGWCKEQAWAERMIARYDSKKAHPDFRETQKLEDKLDA